MKHSFMLKVMTGVGILLGISGCDTFPSASSEGKNVITEAYLLLDEVVGPLEVVSTYHTGNGLNYLKLKTGEVIEVSFENVLVVERPAD